MTKRLDIERVVDCDTNRLYGSLDKAIEYLQEVKEKHPTAELDEHWYGYEDMLMRFVYFSPETDEEYSHRLEVEAMVKKNIEKERVRREKVKALTKEKKKLERKLRDLQ